MYFVFNNSVRITGPNDGETKAKVEELLNAVPRDQLKYWQVFKRQHSPTIDRPGRMVLVYANVKIVEVKKEVVCVD